MVYFPLAGPVDRPAEALRSLGPAPSGYGIYTFILRGNRSESGTPGDVDAYAELVRVIETYVAAAGHAASETEGRAHTFLIPARDVPPRRSATAGGADLPHRLRLELIADYLRAAGRAELAQRVERAPGPFLVSSLEPRLIPADTRSPRMLVDLSDIGPEYVYSVVDAYDRLVPAEQVGTIGGLVAIGERLGAIFPDVAIDATAAQAPRQDWVHMLGQRYGSNRRDVAAEPAPVSMAEIGAGSGTDLGAL
jgi:hypothetical protein